MAYQNALLHKRRHGGGRGQGTIGCPDTDQTAGDSRRDGTLCAGPIGCDRDGTANLVAITDNRNIRRPFPQKCGYISPVD